MENISPDIATNQESKEAIPPEESPATANGAGDSQASHDMPIEPLTSIESANANIEVNTQ